MSRFLCLTFLADAAHVQGTFVDLKAALPRKVEQGYIIWNAKEPMTFFTLEVSVRIGMFCKGARTPDKNLSDYSLGLEPVEVPVNGPKTDVRKLFSRSEIYLLCGQMDVAGIYDIYYRPSLFRPPLDRTCHVNGKDNVIYLFFRSTRNTWPAGPPVYVFFAPLHFLDDPRF